VAAVTYAQPCVRLVDYIQLGITGWASLLVKTHPLVCCISLCKRFLPNLGSYPRWCADGFGDRRQENVPPVSKGCFIMLPKSDVLRARHRLSWRCRGINLDLLPFCARMPQGKAP